MKFSKYKLCYKLLGGVILFKVTPDVTWTQPLYILVEGPCVARFYIKICQTYIIIITK